MALRYSFNRGNIMGKYYFYLPMLGAGGFFGGKPTKEMLENDLQNTVNMLSKEAADEYQGVYVVANCVDNSENRTLLLYHNFKEAKEINFNLETFAEKLRVLRAEKEIDDGQANMDLTRQEAKELTDHDPERTPTKSARMGISGSGS